MLDPEANRVGKGKRAARTFGVGQRGRELLSGRAAYAYAMVADASAVVVVSVGVWEAIM